MGREFAASISDHSGRVLEVIICTFNRAELLRGTLDALAAQKGHESGDWSVLVVDNNCTDHTDEVVKSFEGRLPGLRTVIEPRQGLTEARQRGVLTTNSPWTAFVDDDCRPASDWVLETLRFIRRRPSAAGFNGHNTLLFADGGARPWIHPETFAAVNPVEDGDPVERGELHGAGLVLRRAAVLASCWLDGPQVDDRRGQSLVSGGDNALSLHAAKGGGGGGLWFVPQCRLTHVIDADRLRLDYLVRLTYRLAESRPVMEAMTSPASKHVWRRQSAHRALVGLAKSLLARNAWPDRVPLAFSAANAAVRARIVILGWSQGVGYASGVLHLSSSRDRLGDILGLTADRRADGARTDRSSSSTAGSS